MGFFIGLVLALVCAWLICQFIKKFWKPFFTRFIPKLCKVMMWITLVLSVLYIGVQIVCYVHDCICIQDKMAAYRFLPGDIIPQIRKYGVRGAYLRYDKGVSEEQYEAMIKEQEIINKEERNRIMGEYMNHTGILEVEDYLEDFWPARIRFWFWKKRKGYR